MPVFCFCCPTCKNWKSWGKDHSTSVRSWWSRAEVCIHNFLGLTSKPFFTRYMLHELSDKSSLQLIIIKYNGKPPAGRRSMFRLSLDWIAHNVFPSRACLERKPAGWILNYTKAQRGKRPRQPHLIGRPTPNQTRTQKHTFSMDTVKTDGESLATNNFVGFQ